MSEHTPGPWVEKWSGSAEEKRGGWCIASGYRAVMQAYVTETDARFVLPNAADRALIAAAPDLLAACKAALEVIMSAEATIYGEWGCPLPEYDSVAEQLRDAIALATNSCPAEGREP